MNQTVEGPRRAWVQLRTDPFLPPMLLGYSVAIIAACAASSAAWVGAAVAWVVMWLVFSRICPHGHPRMLASVLTPNFFSVKLISGRRGIYQRRPTNRRGAVDCHQLLRELAADRKRLPASLTPGRYRAITHEMILRRLEAMPNARITRARPAYTADMAAICSAMTRGRCKRCKAQCPFPASKQKPRQFYDVHFEIVN